MSAADTLRARVAVVDAAAVDDLVALRLVFNRDTVLALADLLDEIRQHDRAEDPHSLVECWDEICQRADALEQAITGSQT